MQRFRDAGLSSLTQNFNSARQGFNSGLNTLGQRMSDGWSSMRQAVSPLVEPYPPTQNFGASPHAMPLPAMPSQSMGYGMPYVSSGMLPWQKGLIGLVIIAIIIVIVLSLLVHYNVLTPGLGVTKDSFIPTLFRKNT